MKRWIKSALKALWRSTYPLRLPLHRAVARLLSRSLRPIEVRLVDESRTLMEHVVRELVRLQDQVEQLESAVAELLENGDRAVPPEQLKAG